MTTRLTLNLNEGSVSFPFSPAAARNLQAALNALMQSLKAKVATTGTPTKPTAAETMEYQHVGDVFLEIFCNPNIWATPFAAKALVTLKSDRIQLSTEADLSRIVEDVNQYLEQAE